MTEYATSCWRRANGLASWWFRTCERHTAGELPPCPAGSEPLSEWLAERIRRVVRALPPFAALERLAVETRSGGENSCVLDGSQASILRRFKNFAANEKGIVAARLTLTLHCIDADGTPLTIKSGATVVLEPPFNEFGEVVESDDGIDLRLTLNVDIYSPRNPCPQRDNTRLAALNGPLLSAFIARLEAEVPCRFDMASGDEYIDFMSRRGFELGMPAENE